MADTKTAFYAELATGANGVALVLQLDNDIYGKGSVVTATGITAAKPATSKLVPISRRYALLSKAVVEIKLRLGRGEGENRKFRNITMLVETAKADTAAGELAGEIINLGNGAGVPWTIL